MEIFSLKLKSKNNANVFVASTDEGEFELYSDVIVSRGIKKGKINDNIFFESVEESAVMIGYNLALKYIGGKLKTEKQMRDYLFGKGYRANVVTEIIYKLKEYSVIDDQAYSQAYIKTNVNFSKNKLKQKLKSVGVSVDDCLGLDEVDDRVSCLNNARKYIKNKEINKDIIDKLVRRLKNMGYNWDTIKNTLNELKLEIEEW